MMIWILAHRIHRMENRIATCVFQASVTDNFVRKTADGMIHHDIVILIECSYPQRFSARRRAATLCNEVKTKLRLTLLPRNDFATLREH